MIEIVNFKQINEARELLGLDERATLAEIKKAYKKLAMRYHPDKCKGQEKIKCEEMFKKIVHANDILMAYCVTYRYSFKEKDVKINAFDDEFYKHLKRFYDGWLGDLDL